MAPGLEADGILGLAPTLSPGNPKSGPAGPKTPRKHGAVERQAGRDKALQDLVYRTEYLASLRSGTAAAGAPAGTELVHTPRGLPTPQNLSSATTWLRLNHAQRRRGAPAPRTPYAPYSQKGHPLPGLGGTGAGIPEAGQRSRPVWEDLHSSRPGSPSAGTREVWRGTAAHRSRAEVAVDTRTAWEAFPQSCSAHLFDGVQSMLGATPGLPGAALVHCGGGVVIAPQSAADTPRNPLDTLKVQPVPGVPRSVLAEHHGHAAVLEIARHADKSNYVEQITEEGLADPTTSGLQFARHLWRKQHAAMDSGEETLSPRAISTISDGWLRFCRTDGGHEILGARKFLLTEQSTALVREVGNNPFHSHALVTSDRPIHLFPEGHYFEIMVKSLFTNRHDMVSTGQVSELLSPQGTAQGANQSLHQREVRNGSEGLVLGVTTTALPSIAAQSPPTKMAKDVPRSWCVATSGQFYATNAPAVQPKRPVSLDRIRLKSRWHQRETASEHLTCQWPPPPPPTLDTARRNLDWSLQVREGDRLGILVTSFGGICVVVNGRREVFLPDAGVPADEDLYLLVEAYNHVRSIRAIPWAEPPK